MHVRHHALAGLLGVTVLCAWPSPNPAQVRADAPLPLSVHVAEGPTGPVVSAAFLATQLEHANALFAPAPLAFVVRSNAPLPASLARLESRADRHALSAHTTRGAIDVFIVESLRDVDDPALYRMGVHWRGRPAGVHYVIVASNAREATLAHELGHYFGNPHSPVNNNLMSYTRDGTSPLFLDEVQLTRIRRSARRAIESGALRP